MVATAIITYAILMFNGSGFRKAELVIGAFIIIIGICYLIELIIAPVNWSATARGLVTPKIADSEALLIAVGIVGATVMPHAIYLHSALMQGRAPIESDEQRRTVLRYSNREVVVALSVAGAVNMAMVMMAAGAFNSGHPDVAEIATAYHTLTPLLGAGAAIVFLVSLLASGISSSVVGTMAGQVIMQGFFRRRIPIWIRRLVTMIPAFVVVAMGVNATNALVLSQVMLSLALPVPVIALIILTSDRRIMGSFANGALIRLAAISAAAIVLILNIVLLYQIIFGA